MKHMEDAHGNTVTLGEFCYLMYQGFGEWAVIAFVLDRRHAGDLPDVSWATCDPCEYKMPFYENACLVCSTERGKNV